MRVDTDAVSVLMYLAAVLVLSFEVVAIWRRMYSGLILVELSKGKRAYLWIAIAIFLITLPVLVHDFPRLRSQTVSMLAQAGLFWMWSLPTQAREHGIPMPFEFVQWDRVRGWFWSKPGTLSITVTAASVLGWDRTHEFVVDPEKQPQLSAVLDRLVSAAELLPNSPN